MNVVIGIDPGVETGFAVVLFDGRVPKTVHVCKSTSIHQALYSVRAQSVINLSGVIFEDARLQSGGGGWGSNQAARAQGAGSVKRDSRIWADFLVDYKIPALAVSPGRKGAKWSAKEMCAITDYKPAKGSPTNEHGRDAAKLAWCFGLELMLSAGQK